ncbi:MAG TPA: MerR family transcriptional regulator [Solirubrobacteraceae bacterium]|jgi:DNA-binding transcriptional MerR regulator|nr:MerR family transcriptional regulator [Solirubrobacteraceae bacterium]
MSVIRTNAAAALLGVSPNTLRSWETRFGYPAPRRTEGGHRQFDLAEIEALRQAFAETRDISSAISVARERGEGPSTPARLRAAFAAFGEDKADRLMEESMAVRSVERTVETVLLPAVQALAPGGREEGHGGGEEGRGSGKQVHGDRREAHGDALSSSLVGGPWVGGPEYCFAWRYSTGWLAAAQRVAPPATREEGVLIFDASRSMDIDALHVQALELFLRRAGLRVLTLPVDLDSTRVGSALRALRPQAMVLAGRCASLEAIGRVVYATRQSGGELHVLDYRGALPDTGASTVVRIGPGPAQAVAMLRELLTNPAPAARTVAPPRRALA